MDEEKFKDLEDAGVARRMAWPFNMSEADAREAARVEVDHMRAASERFRTRMRPKIADETMTAPTTPKTETGA